VRPAAREPVTEDYDLAVDEGPRDETRRGDRVSRSNCDAETLAGRARGVDAYFVWHRDTDLRQPTW